MATDAVHTMASFHTRNAMLHEDATACQQRMLRLLLSAVVWLAALGRLQRTRPRCRRTQGLSLAYPPTTPSHIPRVRKENTRMRRVMATLVVVLCMMGCEGDDSRERSNVILPPALQADFPQAPFNAVSGESPKYQATQVLSPQPQQNVTSKRYVMTVSMF